MSHQDIPNHISDGPKECPLNSHCIDTLTPLGSVLLIRYSVRFLGERRVNDPATITKEWFQGLLAKKPIPTQESILILTANSIKIVEPLTQRLLHQNPSSIINSGSVQWAMWPSVKRTTARGDVVASSMRMTEDQRKEVLLQVSAKKMTPDEAMEHVKAAEEKLCVATPPPF
jgi:hypothetical protein